MEIRFANTEAIPLIHHLAHQIWKASYSGILPGEQIKLMLNNMYSKEALAVQFEEGITFLIASREGLAIAFASYSCTDLEQHIYKIHKLYLLPEEQGKGSGRQLVSFIEDYVRNKGATLLELNVNRNNPAFSFYKKTGFEVYQKVDIPYYQFVLNDYVMRKVL